jgi:hypothetical protein
MTARGSVESNSSCESPQKRPRLQDNDAFGFVVSEGDESDNNTDNNDSKHEPSSKAEDDNDDSDYEEKQESKKKRVAKLCRCGATDHFRRRSNSHITPFSNTHLAAPQNAH